MEFNIILEQEFSELSIPLDSAETTESPIILEYWHYIQYPKHYTSSQGPIICILSLKTV